ncbi:MAG: cellulose biosynthesis cyclic di-GMP-binding regulatory protein BcsB [Deltaproteobacteria bacterium]|nr:cellulose biosynthesis cyclic di-GMP-binding regulatory protein BcsB [Deltaproteobacteria bacterium]
MSTRLLVLLALAGSLAAPAPAHAAEDAREAAFEDLAANEMRVRDISFGTDLARDGDMALVGINAISSVRFGIPDYWDVQGEPELHLDVARSAMLIPDVSAITVWADGRPIGTFSLDGDPAEVDTQILKLPLQAESGYHSLQFWAYHRSRLPCELSDHPGLWSRILESSFVRVTYRPKSPDLSLSDWPYPFRDDRDPDPARVVLALGEDPSAEEVKAAGYIASHLGHISGWRPMDLYVHQGSFATAPAGHIIALGRNDAPGQVIGDLSALLGGRPEAELSQAADRISTNNLPKSGMITLAPRAPGSMRSVLGIVGSDGEGLVNLARVLSNKESSGLPVGMVQLIDGFEPPTKMEPRRWTGTVPPETSFTLSDLGNDDRMAMGYHGGTVSIPLNMVPDDHPVPGSARFELVYSYSAQADPTNSRLDVFLNGAAVGGVALDEVDGRNHVKLLLELPVHEMGPESRLDVRFALLQKEEPTCIGEDREHLWGTVHSDSRLTMPRDRWARIPDLSLVRYGAYPFGLHPDLSETVFVLPSQPSRTELQLYAWLSAELGRVARGDRFAYDVRVGALTREATEGRDIIVVDSGPQGALIQKMGLLDSMSFTPKGAPGVSLALASGGMVALGADPRVAYFEEMILPWNKDRAAIVAYAAEPTLFERVGRCLNGSPLFDRLTGRVTRVASCTDLAAIPVEEARVIGERPVREAAYEPIRNNYWLILAGIALLVFVALVLRAFWLALGRSDAYDGEEMPGEVV